MQVNCTSSKLRGVSLINVSSHSDERGQFGRLFCFESLKGVGGFESVKQANHSLSLKQGTVRGLHFQRPPRAETKIVVCLTGAVFDVVLDLRRGSATFGGLMTTVLDANVGGGIVIPKGVAHGFQTLCNDTRLIYFHDADYAKALEGGVSPFDPELGIDWPLPVSTVSERDQSLPAFRDCVSIVNEWEQLT